MVAQELHFTRAANKLHIAQPALSFQIQQLEKSIGTSLFDRSNRQVALTAAGAAILEEARAIVTRSGTLAHRALRASRGEFGTLRVGYLNSATSLFLPDLLREFAANFPGIETTIQEMTPEAQSRALTERLIDVAFTRPIPTKNAASLIQMELYIDRLVVAMPEAHPLAARKEIDLRALSLEPLVQFSQQEAPGMWDLLEQTFSKYGLSFSVKAQPNLMATVLMWVASGYGLSIVPNCVRGLNQVGVTFRNIKQPTPDLGLHMVTLGPYETPAVAGLKQVALKNHDRITAMMHCKRLDQSAETF
jgi:DNA-binding transcriptional LysR family regulator